MHPKDLIRDSYINTHAMWVQEICPPFFFPTFEKLPFIRESGYEVVYVSIMSGRGSEWEGLGGSGSGSGDRVGVGVVRYDVMWSTERCSESLIANKNTFKLFLTLSLQCGTVWPSACPYAYGTGIVSISVLSMYMIIYIYTYTYTYIYI